MLTGDILPNPDRSRWRMVHKDGHAHSRRSFLNALAGLGVTTATASIVWPQQPEKKAQPTGERPKTFRVWVFSDAHVGRDLKNGPRESLADAIRQSESASGFDWDIALDLGDMSGEVGLPKDSEGKEIVRQ